MTPAGLFSMRILQSAIELTPLPFCAIRNKLNSSPI